MSNGHQDLQKPEIPKAPTKRIQKLIRYIVGFGVSVAIGLAPYLGKVNIPGFTPLLKLIPDSVQDTAIPLSSALMGLVAVWIQFNGEEKVSKDWLRRWFTRTFAFSIITFFTLFIVHTLVVVRVDFLGGKEYSRFLVGFTRPERPPCTQEVSDAECIKRITASPSAIESFWGDRQVRLASIALVGTYLLFTSCFGLLVGLLVLQEESKRGQKGQPARPGP